MSEVSEQKALFEWRDYEVNLQPASPLRKLFHIPNGGARPAKTDPRTGRRYSPEGLRLQAMGLAPGMFDICLPVARGGYHGLYIELKTTHGRPSKEQRQWQTWLREEGYLAVFCHGWEAARTVVLDYLCQA